MPQVALDTSFLISFADPERPNHPVALEYYHHCRARNIPMWLSVIAAGEFHVKQPAAHLPLHTLRLLPYNLPHAMRAAEFRRALDDGDESVAKEKRTVIVNDLKIIAQAHEEGIPFILTEDEATLTRVLERLRKKKIAFIHTLLLKDGFIPSRLTEPSQPELPLLHRSSGKKIRL
ncbi:MAG TPA: PIN domain-containing protein [Verrucomicrobiae bacterium]|nr:PIN domain-containing protein [Verrucomicrobiae bacterium]